MLLNALVAQPSSAGRRTLNADLRRGVPTRTTHDGRRSIPGEELRCLPGIRTLADRQDRQGPVRRGAKIIVMEERHAWAQQLAKPGRHAPGAKLFRGCRRMPLALDRKCT